MIEERVKRAIQYGVRTMQAARGPGAKIAANDAGLEGIGERHSIGGVLRSINGTGWRPTTIIDVGVNMGTEGLYNVWPDARIVLIDPVEENWVYLEQIAAKYPNVLPLKVAASDRDEHRTIMVNREGGGADASHGISPEERRNWSEQEVEALTLDTIVSRYDLKPPYVVKLDTDAHEREILAGSSKLLGQAEVWIMEVDKFADYKKDRITPFEVFEAMESVGLAFYDFAGRSYGVAEPVHALRVVDLVFARRRGKLFDATQKVGEWKGDKRDLREKQRADALVANPYI